MAKHSLDRKTAVKASGQARSTAYRTMRGAEWGSPPRLFSDPENDAPAPRPRRSKYEGSEQWFLVADSLLYLHSESRDERASFAEDCHVSEEYEQKLLQGLREICKKRIGQRFQLGKDQKRRFPTRPSQKGQRPMMNLLAEALDQLALKKPKRVQEAVESYASLIQADGRLILTKERNEDDLRRVIWLLQNLQLPLLNLRFLGFCIKDPDDRFSRQKASVKQMQRQFRRLNVRMPESLQYVQPKNMNSEGVLEHIAIEVRWKQKACVAFRYVMAVAAISRFWETYARNPPDASEKGELAETGQALRRSDEAVVTDGRISGWLESAGSQQDFHVVFMRFGWDGSALVWRVCFYEDDAESKLLRKVSFGDDQKLIETAVRGGVSDAAISSFIEAKSGKVPLKLTRQQYQKLTAGQRRDGEPTR